MPEKLTPQEEEALQAVFKTGEANIKMIIENIHKSSDLYNSSIHHSKF
ncbi:MAG: hypothetical protein JWM28_51 [Chitinophagaceae bacterium]|nr:hypothetical protein [Chitinophagaceae bacterium]